MSGEKFCSVPKLCAVVVTAHNFRVKNTSQEGQLLC